MLVEKKTWLKFTKINRQRAITFRGLNCVKNKEPSRKVYSETHDYFLAKLYAWNTDSTVVFHSTNFGIKKLFG